MSELIDRNIVRTINSMVHHSFQGIGGTKFKMTALCKVEHHAFSSLVPFSVRFYQNKIRTISSLIQAPEITDVLAWIFEHIHHSVNIRNTFFFISSCCPINVIIYIDKMMIFLLNSSGSHSDSVIIFWISSRIPIAVNLGKIPLEFHVFTVDRSNSFFFF